MSASPPGSTKPYLIRAIHEWCADNGLTPYLAVRVNEHTRVPMAYVREGEIVLNIGPSAVHHLQMGNEAISFDARFGGVSHDVYIPQAAVIGIYARETGQGMAFDGNEPELSASSGKDDDGAPTEGPKGGGRPQLRVVK